ncbi:MAG: TetR/AcrR family transcriptional regulator [Phenylobacterium sp.]|uniref:TetR/AcrR family transcriptional regulator n=1 Tax=Phenylobacterium sp. TaxID=1871053 RepID=UPI00391B9E2C
MAKAIPPRRRPKQARAQATIAAIFEATAQILETEGEARFTTNRIAERAGVSIGSLYQYFADKQAILVGLAEAENEKVRAQVKAGLAAGRISPTRLMIRLQIAILRDRPNTRRAALKAILAARTPAELAAEGRATTGLLPKSGPRGIEAFVLSRAILGAIRAAVLEDAPFLHEQAFEDALVRLAESGG